MQRRGDTHIILDSIIHIVIFILFFSGMFWFVTSYTLNAAFWEDFYVKEIVYALDRAEPGMEFKLDVSKLAVAAVKTGKPVEDIISIDNVHNTVTVSVRLNAGASFRFFKDVDIVDWKTEVPSGSATTTQFIFTVKEDRNDYLS